MRTTARTKGWARGALSALALTLPGVMWANGDDFFEATNGKSIDLVYFGNIKDTTGRVIEHAVITVAAKSVGLSLPIANDSIGHYRTADVGTVLRLLGETPGPDTVTIECAVPGYRQAKPAYVPNKTQGAVEVDFVMQKLTASN
jgi:hypothetical protein